MLSRSLSLTISGTGNVRQMVLVNIRLNGTPTIGLKGNRLGESKHEKLGRIST